MTADLSHRLVGIIQHLEIERGPDWEARAETLREAAGALTALRARTIEACAVAAEAQDRCGREWVADSLWANILKRAGANVRALKDQA